MKIWKYLWEDLPRNIENCNHTKIEDTIHNLRNVVVTSPTEYHNDSYEFDFLNAFQLQGGDFASFTDLHNEVADDLGYTLTELANCGYHRLEISDKELNIDIRYKPTSKQKQSLRKLTSLSDRNVFYDIKCDGDLRSGKDIDSLFKTLMKCRSFS